MPGIVGLISDKTEDTLFSSMTASLNQRNYTIDSEVNDGIHLALVHLNYINPGKQPLRSSNGRYSLVFQGELFAIDSKPCKTENSAQVFLDLVSESGLAAVQKINGQFAACLFNNTTHTAYLITDRFGTHPVYYTLNNGRLLFAPEVKALLRDNLKKNLDYHSVAELFSFGHLFGYKTLFENISQVPPASIIEFSDGTIKKREYWKAPYHEEVYQKQSIQRKTDKELQEKLSQVLVTATQRQSSSVEKIILPLSGGLDSRYVAALYHHIGKQSIPTFTMGPDESDDQRYATQVATQLGFPHSKFDINPLKTWEAAKTFSFVSDGMSYISGPLQNFEPFEHFFLNRQILTASQMCDALYGSTLWRRRIRSLQENKEPRNVTDDTLVNLFNLYDQNLVKRIFRPEEYKKIEGLYRTVPQSYCDTKQHPLHNYYKLLMNEHGRRGTFGGNIVANHFFEMRMLSYDNDVFDFGWKLPIVYREHQYLYRNTFAGLFPELTKIKRQGYGLKINASKFRYELKVLENKIATIALQSSLKKVAKLYKPWSKPSYTNYKNWFRNELRQELLSFLSQDNLRCKELLNTIFIKELVQEHLSEKKDHSSILWQIINLEYFYRNFVD